MSLTQPHAAIVLAAGSASRFGTSKQLLEWRSETLVHRAARCCLEASCHTVVVMGAAHERVADALNDLPSLHLRYNPAFASGMASSLSIGALAVPDIPTFVLLADQPLVTVDTLYRLRELQANADAAALAYPSGPGVPALFAAGLLPRLRTLSVHTGGAKALLRDPALQVRLLDAPACRRDIDTLADWHAFLSDHPHEH